MPRTYSTRRDGSGFSGAVIEAVWKKAIGSGSLKKDRCGAQIRRGDYGKIMPLGWEIDHIKPVASNGTDDLGNLQPLQWKNNRRKGDIYPGRWVCEVVS